MATVGRLQLAHPALGTAGGPALHASIEGLYEKIGNNIADRYFAITDFDNGETVDLFHNYTTDILNLKYDIYYLSGGEWVRITPFTSPARSAFTVVEKTGSESTTLQITNVSAGNNLEVIVVMTNNVDMLAEGDIADVDITTTAPENEQPVVYNSTTKKYVPGYSIEPAFKVMSISSNVAVIKAGAIILSDGRELYMASDASFNLKTAVNTAGVTAPGASTAYYLYLYLTALPSETSVGSSDRKIYAIASGTSGQFIISATKPQSIDQSIYVPIASLKTDGSSNYTAFANLARRAHTLPASAAQVTTQLTNTIINGGMQFWQRSTAATVGINDTQMNADRFRFRKANTTAVFTASRETSILPTVSQAGAVIPYALKLACTTADASVAATDTVSWQYVVEGYDFSQYIHNKMCRLQFWVYTNKTGTYCVSFRNSAQDRVYVAEYTVNASNTWELKTIDLTFNASGTWLFTNGAGLVIDWTLMAGSTAQTTANAWNTVTAANNVKATSNQVNFSDSTSNIFYLTGVQLVPGNFGVSTIPFFTAGDGYQQELAKCQRYHEKSYDIEVNPGTNTGSGEWTEIAPKSSSFGASIPFAVRKRTAPTMTAYTIFGTSGAVTDNDNGNADVSTSARVKEAYFQWSFSRTSGRQYFFYWIAEAEIQATL